MFEYFRTERKTPDLQKKINYILRLPIAELHILAKTDIQSIEDLRGKKVNFGPAGSGSSLTGTIVFQRPGVNVEQVLIDQQSGLQKLQSGEVAALVRVVPKPVEFFNRIPPNSGLHLVPIPFTKMFADYRPPKSPMQLPLLLSLRYRVQVPLKVMLPARTCEVPFLNHPRLRLRPPLRSPQRRRRAASKVRTST